MQKKINNTPCYISANVGLIMFSGDFGGMEKVVLLLAKELQPYCQRVILYVVVESRAGNERVERLTKHLQDLDQEVSQRVFTTETRYSKKLQEEIRETILNDQIDIVHCHCYKSSYYLSKIQKDLHKHFPPFIVTLHGLFLDKKKPASLFILYAYFYGLLHAKAIILCAKYLQSHLFLPSLRKKKVIFPNGLPDYHNKHSKTRSKKVLSQLWNIAEESLWVTNIGRLAGEKNFSLYIDIAAEIRRIRFNKKIYFLIIGDGKERQALEQRAREKGVDDIVIFTGFYHQIELVYAATDIFMMTSHIEGTSMALLEAMRAGLPIVVSKVGGNKEIIQPEENGLLFTPGSKKDAVKKLKMSIDDSSLRQKITLGARATWEKKFSTSTWIYNHIDLYQKITTKAYKKKT